MTPRRLRWVPTHTALMKELADGISAGERLRAEDLARDPEERARLDREAAERDLRAVNAPSRPL